MSDYSLLQEQLKQALAYIGQLEEGIGNAAAVMPPVNRDVPLVSGTGVVGSPLNSTMGNWYAMGGSGTEYHYAWSGGGPLGTDANTYTPVAGDEGKQVTCTVTAVNGAGTTAAPPSNAVEVLPGSTQMAAAAAPEPEAAKAEPAHAAAAHTTAAHERNRSR